MIKPKPLELLLGFGVSDDFDVLLDGKIVIVDGVHFYLRNDVIFVDCFFCTKSTSLSLLSAHVAQHHGAKDLVECLAKNCRKPVLAAALQVKLLLQFAS